MYTKLVSTCIFLCHDTSEKTKAIGHRSEFQVLGSKTNSCSSLTLNLARFDLVAHKEVVCRETDGDLNRNSSMVTMDVVVARTRRYFCSCA